MKAYVSLHKARPQSQLDAEVFYKGYRRLYVKYDPEQFGEKCINAAFPVVEQSSPDVATFVALGACEKGQGEIYLCVPILPHIQLLDCPERRTEDFWVRHGAAPEHAAHLVMHKGYTRPEVSIGNTQPVRYPEHLNPIARVAHGLISSGLMTAEELHPKLYEAINDALHNAGLPVIPVTRGGAANMDAKWDSLRLGDWGHA